MKKSKLLSFAVIAITTFVTANANAVDRPVFLANGKKSVSVVPGEPVTYTWQLPGATSVTSSYKMNRPDSCAGSGENTRKGPLPWAAKSAGGTISEQAQRCQGGVTYTITIQGKTAAGKNVKATAHVKVLAPALLANGKKSLTASVGQSIAYVWAAPDGATETTSYYKTNRTDDCAIEFGKTYPWVAQSGQGSDTAVVKECQRGRTYTIYYQCKNSLGQTKRISIKVKINS